MGKRIAEKAIGSSKPRRWIRSAVVSSLVLLVIGGPSALHYVWGMGLSPVLTASMVPYADPGDLLISLPIKATQIKIGDVISVHDGETNTNYAHRVIEIDKQQSMLKLVTKGDANPTPELAPVIINPYAQVPKAIVNIKWLGAPLVYLSSTQGQQASISLLVIANLGFIYYVFRRRAKAKSSTDAQEKI